MKVDDIHRQNEILVGCGCCPFPTCPTALVDIELRSKFLYFLSDYPSTASDALNQLFDFDWDSLDWERTYTNTPFSLATGPSGLGGAGVEWLPGLPESNGVGLAYGTQFRYRRRVPFSHAGSYFKFVWSESLLTYNCSVAAAFPGSGFWFETYGDFGCYDPVVLTPKEYVWTGPGTINDPPDPDDPTWVSEWSDPIYVPRGVAGVIGLTMDAWRCYRSSGGQTAKPTRSDDLAIFSP